MREFVKSVETVEVVQSRGQRSEVRGRKSEDSGFKFKVQGSKFKVGTKNEGLLPLTAHQLPTDFQQKLRYSDDI
jgi:hypothetical protein